MRRFFRGLAIILLLLAILAAYLFLYLFPALGQINRGRREALDVERQLQRYARIESTYAAFSVEEEEMLDRLRMQVRESLVLVKSGAELDAFYDDVTAFLRQGAGENQIRDLTVSPGFLKVGAGTDFEGADGEALIAQKLQLTFSAPPPEALRFIFGITAFPSRLRLDALMLDSRNTDFSWSLVLFAYRRGESFRQVSGTRFPLDINSPLLWQPLSGPATTSGSNETVSCRLEAFARPPEPAGQGR